MQTSTDLALPLNISALSVRKAVGKYSGEVRLKGVGSECHGVEGGN
jgi:hypothetical protein